MAIKHNVLYVDASQVFFCTEKKNNDVYFNIKFIQVVILVRQFH